MEVIEIPEQLPDGYNYKINCIEQKEGENFTVSFKIKDIKSKENFKKWLSDYQEKSKFTWRVQRTYNSSGKFNVWHCDYKCQHKTDGRFQRKGIRISKNTDCPATLKVAIKRYFDLPNLKKPDEETQMFPCIIKLHSWHNHSSNSASVLRFRDMSSATREKLVHLFQTGHTAATARHALQTELLLEHPDDYHLIAVDSSMLPSLSIIQHLFNNTFSKVSGAEQGCNIIIDLQNFIENYCDNTGGKAAVKAIESSHVVIALCTPIMQRTIEYLPQVHELVCVEASGNMDKLNHRVYFFSSPTVIGGAPLGCIITNAKGEDVFKAGVKLLNTCLPSSFKNGPKVFMVDEDLEERNVLLEMWPNSQILLSQFHVLKAVWHLLLDAKHSICKEDRPSVYFLIRDLVYAETEAILIEKFSALQLKVPNEKFKNYIKHVWENRHLWASCYRSGLPIISNTATKFVESVFRILNNVILDGVKAHNLVQFTDFLLNKYELYLYQRYLDFNCGTYSNSLLKFLLIENKNLIPKENITFDKDINAYIVQSDKELLFVDVHNCFCSCCIRCTGKACKHIASVVHLENSKLNFKFWYSESLKSTMYKIATGKELAPKQLDHPEPLNHLVLSDDEHVYADACSSESENNETLNSDINENDQENIKRKFEEWCSKVHYGLQHNPETYVPAIKEMLSNTEKCASTETGFISALCNFAKYEGRHTQPVKYCRQAGNQIEVQPRVIARRKALLSGKRKMSASRTPVKLENSQLI